MGGNEVVVVMRFWRILDIQPTSDVSIIKKAYAIKLKKCHPEDNPKGYQKLREAYESAIKHAKRSNTVKNGNEIEAVESSEGFNSVNNRNEVDEDHYNYDDNSSYIYNNHNDDINNSNNEKRKLEQRFDEIIEEAEKIYNDLSLRIDTNCWSTLFNIDMFWDLVNSQKMTYLMLNFITKHHYFPKEIWELLDLNLNIRQNIENIKNTFPNKFVRYMLRRINEPKGLEYKHLINLNLKDVEDFIKYREKAFDEIRDRNFEDAYKSFTKALEIYAFDPDLIRLQSQYYTFNDNTDLALIYLNKLLEKDPTDIVSLLSRAKIFYENKEYKNAIEDLKSTLKIRPDDIENLTFLSQCYISMENYFEAKIIILKAIDINSEDSKLKETLLEINKKIRGKLSYDLLDRPRDKALIAQIKQIDAEIYANYQQDYKKYEEYDPEVSLVRKVFSQENIKTYIILLAVLIAGINLYKRYFNQSEFSILLVNPISYFLGLFFLMFIIYLLRK